MKKKRLFRYGIISILSIGLAVVVLLLWHTKQTQVSKIALIVYGQSVERWDNLRAGVETATKEQGIELNFVNVTEEYSATEQLLKVIREIENGCDGILLAASDSEVIATFLCENNITVPILFLENGINEKKQEVCGDNYGMGNELANLIMERESSISKVAIVYENDQRENVRQRYEGVVDGLKTTIPNQVIWKRSEEEKSIREVLFLQSKITEEAVDIIVSLDNDSTSSLMNAMVNLNKEIPIYTISNTEEAVYYVDRNIIKGLVYQNEYGMGYLAVHSLLNTKKYKKDEINQLVGHQAVTKDNLYDEENQKVIFPFVR